MSWYFVHKWVILHKTLLMKISEEVRPLILYLMTIHDFVINQNETCSPIPSPSNLQMSVNTIKMPAQFVIDGVSNEIDNCLLSIGLQPWFMLSIIKVGDYFTDTMHC